MLQIVLQRLWVVVYNLFLSPLSKFPGPTLWAISRIPWQLSIMRGDPHVDMTALHRRYGPVVRIGPNELAFNTAEAFRDIYSTRIFQKDRTHYPPTINGLDNVITACDDTVHTRHRKLLSHAFSERALRAQEPIIRGHINKLMEKLCEQATKSQGGSAEIDAGVWFNSTTFDITGDLMFSETFGCLESGQLNPWIRIIFESVKLYAFIAVFDQFPWLRSILHAITPESAMQKAIDHFNLGATKVGKRLEMGADRPDFMSALMRNGLVEKGSQQDIKSSDNDHVGTISRGELDANAFLYVSTGLRSNHISFQADSANWLMQTYCGWKRNHRNRSDRLHLFPMQDTSHHESTGS
jgi:cytochrome P450